MNTETTFQRQDLPKKTDGQIVNDRRQMQL